MQVVHSVVVDDCSRALYVADRENSRVLRFSIRAGSDQQINAVDLSHFGPVYAITMGPYGTLLALCWNLGSDKSWIVEIAVQESEASISHLDTQRPSRDECIPSAFNSSIVA